MLLLHNLITSFPGVSGKISYKVPFYYRKSWVCYLNPVKHNRVELCFVRGNEPANQQQLLQANGRKQVSGIMLTHADTLPLEAITELLQEAFLLDEKIPYKSKRKRSDF